MGCETSVKIAHVTATFPPYWAGTGNVAYHHARLLHERGHEVTVFTAATPKDHELSFDFNVERLPAIFRFGNAPLTPSLINKLRGFDIIHLHYPYIFGAELTLVASRSFATPLVLNYHNDLLASDWRSPLFKCYGAVNQRLILSQATRLVATSDDYARHSRFAKTAPNRAEVVALPNGVDCRHFRPAAARPLAFMASLGIPSGVPVILFVGGLDRAHYFKGVDVLLSALESVKNAHVIIVGDGDLRAIYERQAETASPGRIHFVGKLSSDDLVLSYQSATVTVLPSTTQGEAFGMVLIESLACGTPVIASDLPGVRTVVDDQRDGWHIPPKDVAALANTLRNAVSDTNRAKEMGLRGREKVKAHYDWSIIGDKLEHLYQKVLNV